MCWNPGTLPWLGYAENGMDMVGIVSVQPQIPTKRCVNHRPGVFKLNPRAYPVRPSCPPGVDKPYISAGLLHLAAEHLGIYCWVKGHKRGPETSRKGGDGFVDPGFCSGYFGGIAGNKVIRSLAGSQPGYRWYDPESIRSQKKYVLWIASDSGYLPILDVKQGITHPGILRNGCVAKVHRPGFIQNDILQDGSPANRIEYFRLLLPGKVDYFGVTAPFKIKNMIFSGPAVLVISDKFP